MKSNYFVLLAFCVAFVQVSLAQNIATIREYQQTFKTYPFSDPDPVPHPQSRIYPYFRFDGYTDQPVDKKWTVIALENDFIKVLILPEVGGKIWTAIEKSTGKPFIYNNEVIKFRDVAMRGPWTSGGIEANYGIIGHTPNSAAPVDYLTKQNEDGSVSCFLGWLDLLTRTWWRIEVKLEADKAYFTTNSLWYNATPLEQPYYHWMNVGIKAAGNLEFIYDGSHYLGHEGEIGDWPVNTQNGKKVAFYEQNNFGTYKSYHVFGKYSDFFGGYWHDEDFGMGRYAPHDEKAGKKIWIWGLSQQGMIWEKLLTDSNGQYVEVQSGRLFNQAAEGSNLTPFKQKGFAPYSSDSWTEYWFPVKATKGFVKANNVAVLNVKDGKIWLMALQYLNEQLTINNGIDPIFQKKLTLKPMEVFSHDLGDIPLGKMNVHLGEMLLEYEANPKAGLLNRPTSAPKDFDQTTGYALWLQGKQLLHMREFALAEEKLRVSLKREPYFIPALCDLAQVEYRHMHYPQALELLKTALSINTYDGQANYLYGLVNDQMGQMTDAKDGFDIATQSIEYRSAAYTELARVYFNDFDLSKAYTFAQKSLENNSNNYTALQMMSYISREFGQLNRSDSLVEVCLKANPFNPIARAEKLFNSYSRYKNPALSNAQMKDVLRNEMPAEMILECQAYYSRIPGIAMNWFEIFSSPAVVFHNYAGEDALIQSRTPYFPFRPESAKLLEKALEKNAHWKLKYYLGLIKWHFGDLTEAKSLLEQCGDTPDEAPFYAARADLFKNNPQQALKDLKRAATLDPVQWRYGKSLGQWYIDQKNYPQALVEAEQYQSKNPQNYYIGLLYAKTLLLNGQYQKGVDFMRKLQVLPNEGATEGRGLWKEMNLLRATQNLRTKQYNLALENIKDARLWPENLGVGKPYPEDIDERLEDYLEAACQAGLGKKDQAQGLFAKAKSWQKTSAQSTANDLVIKYWSDQKGLTNALKNAKFPENENLRVLGQFLSLAK